MNLHVNILDAVSIIVVVFYVYPFIRYVETGNVKFLWFTIGMIICGIFTLVLKTVTSTFGDSFLRPHAAENCDVLCQGGEAGTHPGFPSGHMAATTFFFVMLYLITFPIGHIGRNKVALIWLGTGISIAMAIARFYKNCHNVTQIVGGAVFGSMFALIWYQILCRTC